MGPHNRSVRSNDGVLFKPIDLIQEDVEMRLMPASQVMT